MAKKYYKIPSDLTKTYADMEIALRTSDGIGLKPLPMRTIGCWLLSILGCLWMVVNGFAKYGALWQKILFILVWMAITALLFSCDSTHRMKIMNVPVLLDYVRKTSRVLMTRNNSNAIPFYSVVGLKKDGIDKKTGMMSFEDGTFGYMYRVVGCASRLLFDSDRDAIVDRVDSFYRKMYTEAELIFLTTKNSQAVYRQKAALKRQYSALHDRDEDLLMLEREKMDVLEHYVGGSFKSIHQYLIIKADNKEMLRSTKSLLQGELENSQLMIKRAVPLYYKDIVAVLRLIYTGKDGGKA